MWLATNALNGSLVNGKGSGDWGSHLIEHTLSVLFDIAHGAGLSIVFPAWMKHFSPQFEQKLAFLGKMVFDLQGSEKEKAEGFILKLEEFFQKINTPIRLSQANISKSEESKILENLELNKASGRVYPMCGKDHAAILAKMW